MLSAIRTFANEIAFCYNVGIRRSRIMEKYKFDERNGRNDDKSHIFPFDFSVLEIIFFIVLVHFTQHLTRITDSNNI